MRGKFDVHPTQHATAQRRSGSPQQPAAHAQQQPGKPDQPNREQPGREKKAPQRDNEEEE